MGPSGAKTRYFLLFPRLKHAERKESEGRVKAKWRRAEGERTEREKRGKGRVKAKCRESGRREKRERKERERRVKEERKEGGRRVCPFAAAAS
jgi:hypothetical protein